MFEQGSMPVLSRVGRVVFSSLELMQSLPQSILPSCTIILALSNNVVGDGEHLIFWIELPWKIRMVHDAIRSYVGICGLHYRLGMSVLYAAVPDLVDAQGPCGCMWKLCWCPCSCCSWGPCWCLWPVLPLKAMWMSEICAIAWILVDVHGPFWHQNPCWFPWSVML